VRRTKKTTKPAPRRDPALKSDEVIACRRYVVIGSDPAEVITVKIGKPRLRKSHGRYECGAEISESGRRWVRYVNGADADEALQLALVLIGTDMSHISGQLKGALSWLEGTRHDLAVPLPPTFALYPVMGSPAAGEKPIPDI
jgi:hypothetical protein